MKKIFFCLVIFMLSFSVFGKKNYCLSKINGYSLVDKTIFPFIVDNKNYCFFAFYTKNPEPFVGTRGNGNLGDAVWFAYYDIKNPANVYSLPKPSDNDWSNVCSVNAISFYDMNDDKKSDITIIGSCERNAINYTFPFVFIRQGENYVLNETVYRNLFGLISLTVNDVREYIKSNGDNFKILQERYTLN